MQATRGSVSSQAQCKPNPIVSAYDLTLYKFYEHALTIVPLVVKIRDIYAI